MQLWLVVPHHLHIAFALHGALSVAFLCGALEHQGMGLSELGISVQILPLQRPQQRGCRLALPIGPG